MSKQQPHHTADDRSRDAAVPTHDYFAQLDLADPADLEEALDSLIHDLESGRFLMWEAVVRQEQGQPLTQAHKRALSRLVNFGDRAEERILYIDEQPRPSEPWYALARQLAPRLLQEPFKTAEMYYGVTFEGWPTLVDCLHAHAPALSLPAEVQSPLDIFPLDLQHRLWLQVCFDMLSGLGQEAELTLANPEQQDRVAGFIDLLKAHKASVQYFDLTLDDLLTRVILPAPDQIILLEMMLKKLGMPSSQEQLARFL